MLPQQAALQDVSGPQGKVSAGSLVSCLCVTRKRVPMLRRAVACFLAQSYAPRELVILYEDDDEETRSFVHQLREPTLRSVEVPAAPKRSLGELRNLARRAANGDFVAQWDDDDWYAPTRLSEQLAALRDHGRAGCVLLRWFMYDCLDDTAYVSGPRAWEGSIVAAQDALPDYPHLVRGEDTAAIEAMLERKQLVALDRPQLYVYTVHGSNTWQRSHWESKLRPYARPLPEALQQQIRSLLSLDRA